MPPFEEIPTGHSTCKVGERVLPTAEPGTALYVHLPFCAAKCHYCDFFSVPDEGHDLGGMVEAILREAELRAPREPRTVFLGGGTPSLLPVELLQRLLERLDELTDFRRSAVEVTAECNPESLDEEKASALLQLGVERLSIGFQSLDQAVLELFGRVHSVEDSFAAFEAARRAGVQDINVDMIYAVPDQSAEQWEADLQRVLSLGPDHLSAYNLTFEEETRFRRWLEQGRLARAPEELELQLFQTTRRMTAEHGLEAYEISNYARRGCRCDHNLGYWGNGDYVGIGPSAVSAVGGIRGGNPKGISAYRRAMEGGSGAISWTEQLEPLERLGETWWLGLRLSEGLDPTLARSRAGWTGAADPALEVAARLAEEGLLQERDGRWSLTARGIPLADGVAREFLLLEGPRESS